MLGKSYIYIYNYDNSCRNTKYKNCFEIGVNEKRKETEILLLIFFSYTR